MVQEQWICDNRCKSKKRGGGVYDTNRGVMRLRELGVSDDNKDKNPKKEKEIGNLKRDGVWCDQKMISRTF